MDRLDLEKIKLEMGTRVSEFTTKNTQTIEEVKMHAEMTDVKCNLQEQLLNPPNSISSAYR